MDEMANHATRLRRIIDRVGIEPVETFIDRCLSLENLINQHAPHFAGRRAADEEEEQPIEVRGFKTQPRVHDRSSSIPRSSSTRRGRSSRKPRREEEVSRAAGARRAAFLHRARAAGARGKRTCLGDSRRGLLFRAAGADEDHERRLGLSASRGRLSLRATASYRSREVVARRFAALSPTAQGSSRSTIAKFRDRETVSCGRAVELNLTDPSNHRVLMRRGVACGSTVEGRRPHRVGRGQ